MGKPGKWFKTFLTGKKDKEKEKDSAKCIENPLTTPNLIPSSTPKEKKRWSFRRSSATPNELNSAEPSVTATLPVAPLDSVDEQKKHDQAMAAATAAATDAAAQVAAAVVRLTEAVKERNSAIEDAAATKIQSVFRSYLARKALCALKGLVKLQALVRGHLVRKQAATTLRCMQALVNVQARARAHRISSVDDANTQRLSVHKKMTQGSRFRHTNYESDGGMEDNIKIVEMDLGGSKGSTRSRNIYSHNSQSERAEHHRLSTHYASTRTFSKQDNSQISPAPSALTEMSPRTYSGHFDFEDCGFGTAQSSPQYGSARSKPDPSKVPFAFPRSEYAEPLSYDYPFFPSYMANTQSSRAKVRSHSAPKQRPDSFERQPSTGRRRASIEGRNVPRAVRMQRSSSHVGATAQNYKYPWAVKLDRSSVSLKESECGSTSTVLTNTNYSRPLVGFDVHGNRY